MRWFRPNGVAYRAGPAPDPGDIERPAHYEGAGEDGTPRCACPYGRSLSPRSGALIMTLTLPSGSFPSPISWCTSPASSYAYV